MIVDKCRDIKELYELYDDCDNSNLPELDTILNLPSYRCFYDDDNKLVGCLYLEDEDGKVMLSGFARRKSYNLILEGIKFVLNLNKKINIFSRTTKINAKIVLRASGFEKIDKDLYIRKVVA